MALDFIKKLFGWKPEKPEKPEESPRETLVKQIRASYDAAQTTAENRRHWANADNLSARASNDPPTRRELRNRSRYEVANNSYARGTALTLASDMVGVGPRLHVLTDNPNVNLRVERAFSEWSKAIRLGEKLRTARTAKFSDGEAFGLFTTNENLPTAVKLDLRLVEADQFAPSDITAGAFKPWIDDGVEFDQNGNPVAYHILKRHPGDWWAPGWGQADRIAARHVVHWFRADRPGQVRGIPELTPALPLFAQLRRFTLATITAAETAALFAAMLETTAPPNAEEPTPTPFEELELARGMMTVAPAGWKMAQLKAEHPSTNHEMFVRAVLREIARCLCLPYQVIAGDSSQSNYSSSRMDHLTYRPLVKVERAQCERVFLDPTLVNWLAEAVLIPGLLPEGLSPAYLPHAWGWPGFESIDPEKDAKTDTERLANGTATLGEIIAESGRDFEEYLRRIATEKRLMAAVMADAKPTPSAAPKIPEATNAAA